MRSYREATRAQYAANADIVKGFRRLSAKDGEVCMACLALDGSFYETLQPIDEHVNGRCAMEPVVVTYKDLGLDVEPPPDTREIGQDWFRNQPAAVQEKQMGKEHFKAWKDGKFDLGDMAKVTENSTWGAQATVKPLKELVG